MLGDALGAVRSVWPRGGAAADGLPPGQGPPRTFPRFGVHFTDPPPQIPPHPAIEGRGAGATRIEIGLADLKDMPRRTLVADFHCVAGWSVRDLEWEGVPFRALWEETILPQAKPDAEVTHLVFVGLDGFGSALTLEDALGE